MAINIDNCIDQNKATETYKLITDCCCFISCNLTNQADFPITIFDLSFSSTFGVGNIFVDSNPISLPLNLYPFKFVIL